MHRTRASLLIGLGTLVVLFAPEASFARPLTVTEVEKVAESFTDTFPCAGDALYVTSGHGQTVTHLTARTDGDGNIVPPLRFHFVLHATITAVPVDGTAPSFVAHYHVADLETIRSVRHGDVIAETDTDHDRLWAKGSDGSRVRMTLHRHFTVNANGEVSVEFEKVTASC